SGGAPRPAGQDLQRGAAGCSAAGRPHGDRAGGFQEAQGFARRGQAGGQRDEPVPQGALWYPVGEAHGVRAEAVPRPGSEGGARHPGADFHSRPQSQPVKRSPDLEGSAPAGCAPFFRLPSSQNSAGLKQNRPALSCGALEETETPWIRWRRLGRKRDGGPGNPSARHDFRRRGGNRIVAPHPATPRKKRKCRGSKGDGLDENETGRSDLRQLVATCGAAEETGTPRLISRRPGRNGNAVDPMTTARMKTRRAVQKSVSPSRLPPPAPLHLRGAPGGERWRLRPRQVV